MDKNHILPQLLEDFKISIPHNCVQAKEDPLETIIGSNNCIAITPCLGLTFSQHQPSKVFWVNSSLIYVPKVFIMFMLSSLVLIAQKV